MLTLEEIILQIKQSLVHKCSASCRPPMHTGSGQYDAIEHIPASYDEQIKAMAKKQFEAQNNV